MVQRLPTDARSWNNLILVDWSMQHCHMLLIIAPFTLNASCLSTYIMYELAVESMSPILIYDIYDDLQGSLHLYCQKYKVKISSFSVVNRNLPICSYATTHAEYIVIHRNIIQYGWALGHTSFLLELLVKMVAWYLTSTNWKIICPILRWRFVWVCCSVVYHILMCSWATWL